MENIELNKQVRKERYEAAKELVDQGTLGQMMVSGFSDEIIIKAVEKQWINAEIALKLIAIK